MIRPFFFRHKKRVIPTLGLALGGGGARGFSQIPYLEVLDEAGVRPIIISGTSIGSIMGAMYAGGMSGNEIRELVCSLDLLEMIRLLDFSIIPHSGFIHGHGVEKFLQKHLPVKTFEELKIPLRIVAADYWSQKEVVFSSGDLLPAIRASISIPGAFSPYVIGQQVLVDGGVVNPVPFNLIRKYCDVLMAIDVSGNRREPEHHRHNPAMRNFDLARFKHGDNSIELPGPIEAFLAAIQTMESTLVDKLRDECPVDIYVKPDLFNVGLMDFHHYERIMKSVESDLDGFRSELRAFGFSALSTTSTFL